MNKFKSKSLESSAHLRTSEKNIFNFHSSIAFDVVSGRVK